MPEIDKLILTIMNTTPLLPWVLLTLLFSIIEPIFSTSTSTTGFHNNLRNIGCGLSVCFVALFVTPISNLIAYIMISHFGGGLINLSPFPTQPLLSLVLTIVIFLFVRDFFFYWWHRWEHKIRLLWDIHAVHHSETLFNSTTYMRQNWIDGALQALFVNIPPLLLLNLSPEAAYAAYITSAAWNFFAHTNLPLNLGPLTSVFTGPQLHRLHHSKLTKHLDKNFAQFFPLIDILFGTYVPPLKNEFPPTGLSSGESIDSVGLMILWPLKKWARRFRATSYSN